MMTVPTPVTPTLSLELPALAELAGRRQWVCWKYVLRDGDWTKAPLQASGIGASSSNPHTWGDLGSIMQAALVGGYGIGYVFDRDVVGVDLDKCRNPKTGEVEPWALAVVRRLDSYTEVSPSGRGLHIICKGPIPRDGARKGKVEIYTSGRYFTVSGEHLPGTAEDIREAGEALDWLWTEHIRGGSQRDTGATFPSIAPAAFPWEKFDALMEGDPKFRASWLHKRGDLEDDQSMSVYDCSLVFLAAAAGWCDEELAALIVQHRNKYGAPEKAGRRDYVSRTIAYVRRESRSRIEGAESTNASMGRVLAQVRAEEVIEGGQDEALRELRGRLRLPIERVIITGTKTAVAYSFILDDERRVGLGNAGDVLEQRSFRRTIFSTTGIVVPMAKQPVWDATVTVLQAAAEREEAADSDPVQELTGALEEYFYRQTVTDWNDDDAPSAFVDSEPLRHKGRLLIAVRHFHRWCMGHNILADAKPEQIRERLRLAGWVGLGISRRVDGKVMRRTFWQEPGNSVTVLEEGNVT